MKQPLLIPFPACDCVWCIYEHSTVLHLQQAYGRLVKLRLGLEMQATRFL